jgi:hypothetical protein
MFAIGGRNKDYSKHLNRHLSFFGALPVKMAGGS